jgi:Ca2+-binding EF-hand superfamily protein
LPPALQNHPENLPLSQVDTNFWLGALLTILQGSVFVHFMPQILSELGIATAIATAPVALDMPFVAHAGVTAGLLALPGLLSLAADTASIPLQNAITSLRNQWESRLDTTEHRVVVELYETIMKSDQPIDETLREFDPDGDGKITCWECKQALGHLKLPDTQCETLMGLMKKHFGNVDSLEIDAWLDYFQELYVNAREADLAHSEKRNMSRFRQLDNELASKKTFVEIFNGLDTDDDGFISENEFSTWIDKSNLKHPLSKKDQHELFRSADVLGHGRLNLFEFMSVMRKIVRVGIQEMYVSLFVDVLFPYYCPHPDSQLCCHSCLLLLEDMATCRWHGPLLRLTGRGSD